MSDKPWGGRFREETLKTVERFTASIGFDRRMYRQDIRGSMAHARMLAAVGVLTDAEAETLVGGKLHTARSRNDQVALDLRLYLADEIGEILDLLRGLCEAFLDRAEPEADALLPGYTHLQRAQPVSFGHHWLAYFEMFFRDAERMLDTLRRTLRSPLGAGALAGSPYPVDRERSARELGMGEVCRNSLDAVSDRDFAVEFLFAASMVMMHLSRLSEELVLWTSQEFGFVELSDGFCTGSSIMPQKKNPDVPELLRGKAGRAYGNLIALLTTLKALPLAYNKDLQEDKEPVFDSLDTVKGSLAIAIEMIRSLSVRRPRARAALAEGFITATDLADYLARKGLPFRQAHEIVGALVAHCAEQGITLEQVSPEVFRSFSPLIEDDVREVLQPEHSLQARTAVGGPAPENVRREVRLGRQRLDDLWSRRG